MEQSMKHNTWVYGIKDGRMFKKPKVIANKYVIEQPERFRYPTPFEIVWNWLSKEDYKNIWKIGKIITGIVSIALAILINWKAIIQNLGCQ